MAIQRNMTNQCSSMKILMLLLALCANNVYAQNVDTTKTEPLVEKQKPTGDANTLTKKTVQSATINLQTTVTGNQEQPRVLYILPWQSPATDDVDFESLDNQQKSVFSHVEREELRRELESSGEK